MLPGSMPVYLGEVFPELDKISETAFRGLRVACPNCLGSSVKCGTCNGMRVVCPRCTGGRFLRDNRSGISLGEDLAICSACMSPKTGGKGWEVDPSKEMVAIRAWLRAWAEAEGMAVDYGPVYSSGPDPKLPI